MISYKLILRPPTMLEFQLLNVSGDFVRFMIKQHKVYLTSKGVIVQMLGNRVVLEEDEGPSDSVVGISLPDKIGLITSPPQIEYTSIRKFTNNADFEEYCASLVEALSEVCKKARDEALARSGHPPLSGNPLIFILGDER